MANTLEEKQKYVKEYIRSLNAIEEAMEPYKEQKRELRKEFRDNGWLSTDEIRTAVKAYRFMKSELNVDEFYDAYNLILNKKRNTNAA